METRELTGPALDWAVAEAEGLKSEAWHTKAITVLYPGAPRFTPFLPSRDWAQGGPIIEQENISVTFGDMVGVNLWNAELWPDYSKPCTARGNGPTPLVAAMRCFVASKLGDEVEVPEELK
jgi:hypothetical protein